MNESNNIATFNFSGRGKLNAQEVSELLKSTCHYVDYVVFTENSKEQLVALIFPDKQLLKNPDYQKTPEEGCFCPRNLDEVGRCLTGCLKKANAELTNKNTPISLAIIVGEKFILDNGKLTDLAQEKIATIIEKYQTTSSSDDVYIIDLETTRG
jgi:hypothetical protein